MDITEIKLYFESLNISGWRVTGNIHSGGQAKAVEVRNDEINKKGVFRFLTRKNEVDIKRFKREISILSEPKYKHENIINILDYSKDENQFWYISEKGDTFESFWLKFREETPDSNIILSKSIEIVKGLLSGLSVLHKQKIIHRDIKPDNIVIVNEKPVLIDFGLVYREDEDRLTPIDSAVGNVRYSPDQMMNRLEEIPAWLDVFQLSQTLIWMNSKRPTKNWSRPLDWRWVIYPQDMSDENVLSLRAYTASCSNPSTSPQDASELLKLVEVLFDKKVVTTLDTSSQLILDSINKGKTQSILNYANNHQILNAEFPIFLKLSNELKSVFQSIYDNLDSQIPKNISFCKLDNWIDEINKIEKFKFENSRIYTREAFMLEFGDNRENGFELIIDFNMQVPEHRESYSMQIAPNCINFWFRISLRSNHRIFQEKRLSEFYYVFITKFGELQSHNVYSWKPKNEIGNSMQDLSIALRSWVANPTIWETVN